ncbi:MAG: FapA family protein [Spirochaetaceae bacterium]
MKSNKDYVKEDRLNKIQSLLDDSDLEKLLETENVQDNVVVDGDDIPILVNETFPGALKFRLDAMKMNLYMDLKAPVNSENEITMVDIKTEIDKMEISNDSSIDWEYIRDLYTRILFDGEMLPEIIIAKGKAVSFHVPEHIILKDNMNISTKPEIDDDGKVNFHHINSFIIVAKGEFLGDIIPELPGVVGINLVGNEINPPIRIVNNLKAGENVIKQSGRIYSNIDGSFKVADNKIIVEPVLNIITDINYSTGDLNFKGDIVIQKSIIESFSVISTGDIIVSESIEPSDIICGNNINVKHGIIGSAKYSVECEGSITALHIETANINSVGFISAENGIMNSRINTLDKIIIDQKHSIVGGVYYAQNGVVCGSIGNDSGIETRFYLGIDYQVEQKLTKVQEASIHLVEEMNSIQEDILSCTNREEKDKFKFLFLSIKSRLNSLNNYSRSLLSRLDKNENSNLIVLGTVFPGTYIEICHISYIVERELTMVKFSLNKSEGDLKIDNL